MERTIKVTGKGKLSVKPDMIRLDIYAEVHFKDYDTAVLQAEKETDILREIVRKAGLDPKELKTVHFGIDTEFRYDSRKRKLLGYKYRHNMYITFPNKNEILGKVLFGLAKCPVKVEFSIVHTLKDVEAIKNQLIGKAVTDSKEKAKVLAEAAGVKLGNIIKIDYTWGEIEAYARPFQMMENRTDLCLGEMSDGRYHMNIEADDIDLQDTVTVVWEIG